MIPYIKNEVVYTARKTGLCIFLPVRALLLDNL